MTQQLTHSAVSRMQSCKHIVRRRCQHEAGIISGRMEEPWRRFCRANEWNTDEALVPVNDADVRLVQSPSLR